MTTSVPELILTDLPLTVLTRVLENADWATCRVLGSVSKTMCDAVDAHVMSELKKTIHKGLVRDPKNQEANVLQVLYIVADPFVERGLASTFVGCFMATAHQQDPFKRDMNEIVPFLLKFFSNMEGFCAQCTQQSRLLFTVTIMHVLRSFQNREILDTFSKSNQWRLILELHGPWFGFVNAARCLPPERHCNFLVVLVKLLYFNLTQRDYTSLSERKTSKFIYGHQQPMGHVPMSVTRFSIEVNGPQKICQLIKQTFEGVTNGVEWPETLPTQEFNAAMEVYSPRASHHGCAERMFVSSVPLQERAIWEYREKPYSDEDSD